MTLRRDFAKLRYQAHCWSVVCSDVKAAVCAVGAALALAACTLPGTAAPCPQIDWVDFVKVGSTMYVAGQGSVDATPLQDPDLGAVYATVKFKVADHVCDPNYRPKDGDAAFLEPGTQLYVVRGVAPAEALAARHDGRIWEYRRQT